MVLDRLCRQATGTLYPALFGCLSVVGFDVGRLQLLQLDIAKIGDQVPALGERRR